jgi:hypothetical protein
MIFKYALPFYDGWEEDLLFLGGRGAGGKANQGGLPGASVIGNLN